MLALSGFNPLLPKPRDYQTEPLSTIAKDYSRACLSLLNQPQLKSLNLAGILANFNWSRIQTKVSSSPQSSSKNFQKIDPLFLIDLYKKLCRPNPDPTALNSFRSDIQSAEGIYTNVVENLPPIGNLHNLVLPQAVDILSSSGGVIGDIFKPGGRRDSLLLSQMPPAIPETLVAVEDRRFYQHHGVDQIGIVRALLTGYASHGLEGASTITQQLARNLFLNDKVSYRRKLEEMLLAGEIEHQLTKNQILQLYLNLIYFGRDSWGIEKAAETYFNKSVKNLTPVEIAYLIGIIKGPNLYQYPSQRTQRRVQFVLDRMYQAKIIAQPIQLDVKKDLRFAPPDFDHAGYFRDFVIRSIGPAEFKRIAARGAPIRTTLNDQLQSIAQKALRSGLEAYEKSAHRDYWRGPLTNLSVKLARANLAFNKSQELQKLTQEKSTQSLWNESLLNSSSLATQASLSRQNAMAKPATDDTSTPYWLQSLRNAIVKFPPPLSSWRVGLVLNHPMLHIGLANGSIVTLNRQSRIWARPLEFGDLVYVTRIKDSNRWQIVQPPKVNGGVIILNAKTGAILAMVGGFSYQLSAWNRTLSERQPGSLMKPFTYMAALQAGFQPNFLLNDGPFVFPATAKGGHRWKPKNDEDNYVGSRPMRWAFEQSRNTMTADLMSYIGLNPIRALTKEFGLYRHPDTNYPFILGDQNVNLLSICRAYAGIDTGYLPQIQFIAPSISARKGVILQRTPITGVDPITLFQMRYLMQGVVARGTAALAMSDLAPDVAGKTGTTEDSRSTWFVGFTPKIVVGAYVGYDMPRSMGENAVGGTVAAPIVAQIFRQSYKVYAPAEPFPPPPPGVTFFITDRHNGQIESKMDNDTIVEAYRSSRVIEKPERSSL